MIPLTSGTFNLIEHTLREGPDPRAPRGGPINQASREGSLPGSLGSPSAAPRGPPRGPDTPPPAGAGKLPPSRGACGHPPDLQGAVASPFPQFPSPPPPLPLEVQQALSSSPWQGMGRGRSAPSTLRGSSEHWVMGRGHCSPLPLHRATQTPSCHCPPLGLLSPPSQGHRRPPPTLAVKSDEGPTPLLPLCTPRQPIRPFC